MACWYVTWIVTVPFLMFYKNVYKIHGSHSSWNPLLEHDETDKVNYATWCEPTFSDIQSTGKEFASKFAQWLLVFIFIIKSREQKFCLFWVSFHFYQLIINGISYNIYLLNTVWREAVCSLKTFTPRGIYSVHIRDSLSLEGFFIFSPGWP